MSFRLTHISASHHLMRGTAVDNPPDATTHHRVISANTPQIHELVLQLRDQAGNRQVEKARIALAENGGGNIGLEEAAMGIHILEKNK